VCVCVCVCLCACVLDECASPKEGAQQCILNRCAKEQRGIRRPFGCQQARATPSRGRVACRSARTRPAGQACSAVPIHMSSPAATYVLVRCACAGWMLVHQERGRVCAHRCASGSGSCKCVLGPEGWVLVMWVGWGVRRGRPPHARTQGAWGGAGAWGLVAQAAPQRARTGMHHTLHASARRACPPEGDRAYVA